MPSSGISKTNYEITDVRGWTTDKCQLRHQTTAKILQTSQNHIARIGNVAYHQLNPWCISCAITKKNSQTELPRPPPFPVIHEGQAVPKPEKLLGSNYTVDTHPVERPNHQQKLHGRTLNEPKKLYPTLLKEKMLHQVRRDASIKKGNPRWPARHSSQGIYWSQVPS